MPIINTSLQITVIPAGKLESSHREVTQGITMSSMDSGFRPPCRNDGLIKPRLTTERTESTENKNLPSVTSVLSVSKASDNVLRGKH